jgi:S-DNA-T family DNA segregation ATPase FtsK/SpoIIIE
MRDILDRQANSIEYILHTHGIHARVDGGRLSPRLSHFHIVLPPGVRPTQLSPLVPEMSEALGVTSSRLALEPSGEGVFLEVPRPDPIPVRLLPLVQRVADIVPPLTATLGLDTEGTPLLLRLNAPDVDPLLISGGRAAGKSRLLRGMALSLSLHNSPDRLKLLLLDVTGDNVAFKGMQGLPHLACPIADGTLDSLAGLRWALRTLTRRESGSRSAHSDELFFDDEDEDVPHANHIQSQDDSPALVIMIDGVDRLLSTSDRRARTEASDALNRLLTTGNRHNIHIVVSSEHPDLDLEVNWGGRVTGQTTSAEMARLATGMKGSGAQGLLGSGDFLISLNNELLRFQAGTVSSAETDKAIALINSWANAPRSRGAVSPPEGIATLPPRRERERERGPEHYIEEPIPLRRSWAGE